jgi:histidinol-phosphatase (PHP family)
MYATLVDHHIHSSFSWDCESSLGELIQLARRINLLGFVAADHVEFDPGDPGFGVYDYARAREAWGLVAHECPDIKVKFGAEVTHQERYLDEIRRFLQDRAFHWLVGSAHYVGREELSAYIARIEMEGGGLEESLNPYFETCLDISESRIYDCLGHLDFPKRYSRRGDALTGEFWMQHYGKIIRQILTSCLDNGVFLEVNTASYRRGFAEPFPGWAILKVYRELGGREVVLSSDAHRPEDLGTAFDVVIRSLASLDIRVRNGVV